MTPQGRGKPKSKGRKKSDSIPNMVVVTVTDSKDSRSLDVGVTGNLKLTEAPSLLRLAAQKAEQQLGID